MEETSRDEKIAEALLLHFFSNTFKFGFHCMLLSPSKAEKYISCGGNWNVSVHAQPTTCGGWWGVLISQNISVFQGELIYNHFNSGG